MKQKKRRVKLFNPLAEEVENIISKVKFDLTSCPLPSDIEDLSQSIFNSLIDSIPNIDPDFIFDKKQPVNTQIINIMNNSGEENEINFDKFWAEWLKFRASIWSLSSISVVDDIYESYIKEKLEELKIIIENVESKEQISTPTIKYEFDQVKDLVGKAFSNLYSIILDPILSYTDDYDEEDDNIDQQKEEQRIKSLMSHRTQIRRIRDDFSTRYKNFFQLSNQERSITDVQHRRCIALIEEMLVALNKLSDQHNNFNSLKEDLYKAEKKLSKKTIPLSKNNALSPIYKDSEKILILPEDAESVNAESIISNLISSRSNSPFNSPLNSPNKSIPSKNESPNKFNNVKTNPKNDNMVTPIKKQERTWKTPEPQAPPAVIQPLSLHEFSGVPDSFKDLSRRFNTSDSDYISASSSPVNKQKFQYQKSSLIHDQKKSLNDSSKKNQKAKTVVFNRDQVQINHNNRNQTTYPQSSIKQENESNELTKNPENEIENDNKNDSDSISSYTSDDEDPASVSRNSKIEAIFSPVEPNNEIEQDKKDEVQQIKEKSPEKPKKRKGSDPVIFNQNRKRKLNSASDIFDSTFLKPKRKISDYNISVSSSIFSASSKLNHSLDNISIKSKAKTSKQQKPQPRSQQKQKKNNQEEEITRSFSSSTPPSPSLMIHNENDDNSISPSRSSPIINRNKLLKSPESQKMSDFNDDEVDDRDELTRLKDDYDTLLIQLNVYSEENKELQTANEEIPYLKKKIDFYEDLEAFYDDEIQRLYQTIDSLRKKISKNTKDESIYRENSRLHREKDLLFSKLQNFQKELSAVSSKSRSSNELLLMLREEKEKNEKLKQELNDVKNSKKKKNNVLNEEEFNERKLIFDKETENVKLQIKMENLNVKIIHLKSKIKRYKIRLAQNETSKSKESKEIEKLENEIAAIRNSFESIQDLRYNQQDELFKEKTKNDFLQSTINKLNEKIKNPAYDIESDLMNDLKEKIQENRNLKVENDKVKSTLFELYHLICGEALTDDVDDVTILLDGIRQHLT